MNRLIDRLLKDFPAHGLAEALLEEIHRNLARAEARQADLLTDFGKARVDLLFDGRRGHHDVEGALEAIGRLFNDLHGESAIPLDR